MSPLIVQFDDLAVEILPEAMSLILHHRQRRFYYRESGGQMFARLSPNRWCIEVVTGPRCGDRRGRFQFWPDRRAEQDEINRFYDQGLEFVGDWHTHPEDFPRPSRNDIDSVDNIVRKSVHSLPGILMCIVGRKDPPDGLWLSFHSHGGDMLAPKSVRCVW
ncbi:Mov34/MPN/PAD-1 family protein [Mycoplana dimorpha]|uniref:Mov34/MPN/PAD-1 family protein n=1 Tax=Mycoplana dimorpha TaxID=28320 RepID=UPI000D3D920B|nr:Mov34/MPN/PAD-1 family protein [Mycoplana dimorpha]